MKNDEKISLNSDGLFRLTYADVIKAGKEMADQGMLVAQDENEKYTAYFLENGRKCVVGAALPETLDCSKNLGIDVFSEEDNDLFVPESDMELIGDIQSLHDEICFSSGKRRKENLKCFLNFLNSEYKRLFDGGAEANLFDAKRSKNYG